MTAMGARGKQKKGCKIVNTPQMEIIQSKVQTVVAQSCSQVYAMFPSPGST